MSRVGFGKPLEQMPIDHGTILEELQQHVACAEDPQTRQAAEARYQEAKQFVDREKTKICQQYEIASGEVLELDEGSPVGSFRDLFGPLPQNAEQESQQLRLGLLYIAALLQVETEDLPTLRVDPRLLITQPGKDWVGLIEKTVGVLQQLAIDLSIPEGHALVKQATLDNVLAELREFRACVVGN